jgi:hypothetical protein
MRGIAITGSIRRFFPLVLLMLFASSVIQAQQKDVTFFVIGKHANFDQAPGGEPEPADFSFFSEIFFTADGNAENAFMNMPTGERIRFRDQRLVEGPEKDNLLLIRGAKRFSSYNELQSWYPDGKYSIEFDSPSGSVSNTSLEFPQNGLPNPPTLSLSQDGQSICNEVDPAKDLVVNWSKFSQGSADENGILDDLIFAILEDETGQRVSHSGRPFEGKPYLTYANSSHTIAASAMQPGKTYTLNVEHAVLTDTQRIDSVPAMTTYAVTTRLTFTTAKGISTKCSEHKIKEAADMRPSTDAQVVMFYYKDLSEVDRFYGKVLGFEKTLDYDWIKMFKTSADATVGLVAESEGAWHQVQEKNAVMLSIVTSEVDAWYDRLRQKDGIIFLKEIGDGGPIRSFLIQDPGGYTIEFFEWLKTSE